MTGPEAWWRLQWTGRRTWTRLGSIPSIPTLTDLYTAREARRAERFGRFSAFTPRWLDFWRTPARMRTLVAVYLATVAIGFLCLAAGVRLPAAFIVLLSAVFTDGSLPPVRRPRARGRGGPRPGLPRRRSPGLTPVR